MSLEMMGLWAGFTLFSLALGTYGIVRIGMDLEKKGKNEYVI